MQEARVRRSETKELNSTEKLICELFNKKLIVTNRPHKYTGKSAELTLKDILCAIDENPRLLAPTIIMLAQDSILHNKLKDGLPEDMNKTIFALANKENPGPDCRYEKYQKLNFLFKLRAKPNISCDILEKYEQGNDNCRPKSVRSKNRTGP